MAVGLCLATGPVLVPPALSGAQAAAEPEPGRDEPVRAELRSRLEPPEGPDAPAVGTAERWAGGEPLRAGPWLRRFYAERDYRPAWVAEATPTAALDSLLRALRGAELEGLRPTDYHLLTLATLLAAARHELRRGAEPDPATLADLDLLATDAYLTYGSHLLSGAVDPVTLDHVWTGSPREGDLPAHLEAALADGRIQQSLKDLFFASHPGYFRLRSALARYRAIAREGGWPAVPGDTLRPGDRGHAVAILRGRLERTGDLPLLRLAAAGAEGVPDPEEVGEGSGALYDGALENGVRRFQARHGLEEDGVAGPATLRALNVPASERVRQLEVNLERWRWLPQDLGARYILVNIAAFRVEVIEHVRPVLRMRAIVGRDYRQTPVFSDTMTYLVFNPSWTLPPGIAARDKLPLIREDPDYLRRGGYRLYAGHGADAPLVDPDTVDWSGMTAERFRRLRLWQAPGPTNALGRVKFMFPNRFDVYLHDTPERGLFARTVRDFSSGCIRLERPIELAAYLLADQEGWTGARIDEALARGEERTVRLSRAVPIHIQYWTAWTEADGTVHFREDLYGRDRDVLRALGEAPRGIPPRRLR